MAAQTALTLNTKVYAPRGKSGDIASWKLVGDTTFGGATSTASQSLREDAKAGTTRVQYKLVLPKAASEDTSCACIGQSLGTGNCDIIVTIPASFTATERDDFAKRIQSLVASGVFLSSIGSLEPVW
nr:MAG: coat protein [Leviviridae sp.]